MVFPHRIIHRYLPMLVDLPYIAKTRYLSDYFAKKRDRQNKRSLIAPLVPNTSCVELDEKVRPTPIPQIQYVQLIAADQCQYVYIKQDINTFLPR